MRNKKTALTILIVSVISLGVYGYVRFGRGPAEDPAMTEESFSDNTGTVLLSDLTGYYKAEKKNMYLKVSDSANRLSIYQMWDGRKIMFERKSQLAFFAKELSFPLRFIRNKDGVIDKAIAFKADVWNRIREFKYVELKQIVLSPEKLKEFEGRYRFKDNKKMNLEITALNDQLLFKQLWDGRELKFVPSAEQEFFSKGLIFPLRFDRNSEGIVTQLTALETDVWEKVKKE
jgi:hypothetical protein